jgi:hypothetical protein
MITRCELPRNTGSDGDSVAQSEADQFKMPGLLATV